MIMYTQLMDEAKKPDMPVSNIEEPIGNFVNIFPELNLTRDQVRRKMELTFTIKEVRPLEYFKDVGNGMNIETQQDEIAKIIPNVLVDQKHRAKMALDYLDKGNHIGVSNEQYEKDLAKGKNHDETMRFFLEKILSGEKLEPCVVVTTNLAETKFGNGINKVILDGTHRAVAASLADSTLEVLEFSAD